MNLPLKIILQKPPAAVDFALQKGSGTKFGHVQKQRSAGHDLVFNLEVTVKRSKDGDPDFFGPFVQGPSTERFIYIGIGTYAGTPGAFWARRLKIPLRGITWQQTEQAGANNAFILCTTIPGTGRDGGPNCATVKPFDGWTVVAN